jgi:GT2 family glycosyltransferase
MTQAREEIPAEAPPDFDEAAYMVAFPRIAESIRGGHYKSALDHYIRRGEAEGRLGEARYRKALAAQHMMRNLSTSTLTQAVTPGECPSGIDTMIIAPCGLYVVIGWIDDRAQALTEVTLQLAGGGSIRASGVSRSRRADTEALLGCPPGHLLGFWALFDVPTAQASVPGGHIRLHAGEKITQHPSKPRLMPDEALRDAVFEYFAGTTYVGAPAVEGFLALEDGIGAGLLALNRRVSSGIAAQAHVERHGRQDRGFRASIIVCLYGYCDFLFLQTALFSAAPGADAYEFIYVSNSPEFSETLQREAKVSSAIYDLSITLIFLTGNAGFGAANNLAVSHARSARILIMNPDVLPRDTHWPRLHAQLLDTLPPEQTRIFGAPLFYADGALMHSGMFYEIDDKVSLRAESIRPLSILRCTHYAKGAPPETPQFRRSRMVPGVSGALIAASRPWFEKLGGFTEDYAFGHYEDADLCLKSWARGQPVWLHDVPLWHMEGKGGTQLAAHQGGASVNRWHFTKTWLATVQAGFEGPDAAALRQAAAK